MLDIVYLTLICHLKILNVTDASLFLLVVHMSWETTGIQQISVHELIDSVIDQKNKSYSVMHISLLF